MKLALFMTYGGSLEGWQSAGILERELALYRDHARNGVDVTIVSYGGPRDPEIAAAYPELRVLANGGALHPRLYGWLAPYWHAASLRGTQVVKTNQLYGARQAAVAARRLRCPLVIRQGYGHVEHRRREHGAGSREARRAEAYERRLLPAADSCVFTSAAVAEGARSRSGIPAAKVVVLPNYLLPDHWSPPFDRFRSFEDGSPVRIAFYGRFTEQKNLEALIRAAAGLPLHLELIGDGPQRESLARMAAEHRVSAAFPGRLSHEKLRAAAVACDAFVLPSLYEGHPKALIEAMALGVPVLGADSPGIREEIADGETGILAAPTREGLRHGLRRVLALSAERRSAMGRAARAFALETYAVESIAARERALFARLIEERAGP